MLNTNHFVQDGCAIVGDGDIAVWADKQLVKALWPKRRTQCAGNGLCSEDVSLGAANPTTNTQKKKKIGARSKEQSESSKLSRAKREREHKVEQCCGRRKEFKRRGRRER